MFLIKRIITVISVILGGSLGLIFVAFLNWAFSLSLSFTYIFFIGVIGGAVTGVFASYLITVYLMRKAKRFVVSKLLGLNGRLSTMRSI